MSININGNFPPCRGRVDSSLVDELRSSLAMQFYAQMKQNDEAEFSQFVESELN